MVNTAFHASHPRPLIQPRTERTKNILSLALKGVSPISIAKRLKTDEAAVRSYVSALRQSGHPIRNFRYAPVQIGQLEAILPFDTIDALMAEAERRGMSPLTLLSELVTAIADEKLFEAVLPTGEAMS